MEVSKHVSFFLRHLRMLPSAYQSADSQRMTIGYFCLSALDLLGAVDTKIKEDERQELIEWVYDQQLSYARGGGFRGAPLYGPESKLCSAEQDAKAASVGSSGHLAMTYTALLILAILRDDFSRLDVDGIKLLLANSQQSDGSFAAGRDQIECDVRFSFCAIALAYMVDAWDSIDLESALTFLSRCQTYDGAFAQQPLEESHGGSTYCAVAAYNLAGKGDEIKNRLMLERWLLSRQQQDSGFNGRAEKPVDTCYSFWCGGALSILGSHQFINTAADVKWLHSTQSKIGGFSKLLGDPPDAMHSYMGLAALALHEQESLQRLHADLNIGAESRKWLTQHLRSRRPA